jgi:DNA primase catalytic subunit
MKLSEVVRYYARDDIQQAIIRVAKNREVAGVYRGGEFSKRPNMLVYPQDIIAMVRSGILEFHSSIERWTNPMAIKPENYDDVRLGWDLVLDLDCKDFEHGRVAAKIFCKALEKHDIRNYSIKFTGGTGFHIGIPWETIPKTIDYKESVLLFPDLARNMGLYMRSFVKEGFERALLKKWSPEEMAEMTKKPLGKLFEGDAFNPFQVVDVDPILISPRHLFRMPYSINKKTWLVSVPLKASDLDDFRREDATADKVKPKLGFLDSGEENESSLLISETIDWTLRQKKEKRKIHREHREFKGSIPKEDFPKSINQLLNGLSDGRKRALFILITFTRSVGWQWPQIETLVEEWNMKNSPPLRENYIRSQLRWHIQQNRKILPPNYTGTGWYADIGLIDPESEKMKNPVNVATKNFFEKMDTKPKKKKKSK